MVHPWRYGKPFRQAGYVMNCLKLIYPQQVMKSLKNLDSHDPFHADCPEAALCGFKDIICPSTALHRGFRLYNGCLLTIIHRKLARRPPSIGRGQEAVRRTLPVPDSQPPDLLWRSSFMRSAWRRYEALETFMSPA